MRRQTWIKTCSSVCGRVKPKMAAAWCLCAITETQPYVSVVTGLIFITILAQSVEREKAQNFFLSFSFFTGK